MAIESITDVAQMQLCTGCGVCSYLEPDRFRMANIVNFGLRPLVRESAKPESFDSLKACPGVQLAHPPDLADQPGVDRDLLDGWGPVYGVWEGYAADAEIRFTGSSGGVATGLALYCLEQEGSAGVLHCAAREDAPYLNETVMSTTRAQLLARTGSRYSPASPADGLQKIESAVGACVFIGKPCDVAAGKNACFLRPTLADKVHLLIAFFCAGTPSTRGTIELLRLQGIENVKAVKELRYRGNGWPGVWRVRFSGKGGADAVRELTYEQSWGFLQKYRQWRCYICPDHTGEFADVALGDPWYREVGEGEIGKSLVVARTKKGLDTVKSAEAAGYIVLERESADLLPRSQPNLLATRGSLWARLKVLKFLGAPVPRYEGFNFFRCWMNHLTATEKLISIFGSARRVYAKNLKKPQRLEEG